MSLKVRKKKASTRTPKDFDTKYLGPEPKPTVYPTTLREEAVLLNWFNYFKTTSEIRDYYVAWCKDKLSKQQLSVLRNNTHLIPKHYGVKARLLSNGTIISEAEQKRMKDFAVKVAKENKPATVKQEKKKDAAPKLSVHQLMVQKVNDITAYLDTAIDSLYGEAENPIEDPVYTFLSLKEVKARPAALIIERYQPELDDINTGEGYIDVPPGVIEEHKKFLEEIIEACERIQTVQKLTKRANKKKKPGVKKADLSKLKYKPHDDTYKITSEDPEKLIGAKAVWILNTKYKNLILFRAATTDGFGIKGTTLTNVDMDLSMMKRVKKPAETLKLIEKSTPAKTIKPKVNPIMKGLGTKPRALKTPRINEEMVLIKIFK